MPKLLQLNVTANWGSTGKIAEGIGRAAMKCGWESKIGFGRMSNPSQSDIIKVGSQKDVYLHYARHRLIDGEGLGSRGATLRLIDRIKEYSPDIIQLHNIHDHWLNYPVLFEYFASIPTPIVWTFHDCWAFTGRCSHFESIGCAKWLEGCGHCPMRSKFAIDRSSTNYNIKKRLFTTIGRRLTVVCVSDWLADYVRRSFLKDCDVITINNGIDTNSFKPAVNVAKDKMILGVSNVWPDYKGLPDFIRLREILPDDIKITLVGLTKKQISCLPAGINGITRTADIQQLINMYSQAAIFVNPTHNDSFPTVNLEALSCGTPVITYRTGGSPEAIDEKTGIIVEKGDINGLAGAIMSVIDREQTYSSDDCRSRAVSHFNSITQFDKYIRLYESLLS